MTYNCLISQMIDSSKALEELEDKGFNLMLSIIKLKSDISLCHTNF